MGLFSRSRPRPERDPLEKRAGRLLLAARKGSDELLRDLARTHPEVRWAKETDWRFFLTAAALYLASLRLYEEVSPERHAFLSETMNATLPFGTVQAMTECGVFMTRTGGGTVEPTLFASSLGYWVLTRVFRRVPSSDHAELATKIGLALISGFGDWWKEAP